MKPLRTLLLAGIALPLIAVMATGVSSQVPPPGGPGAAFCRPGPDGQPPVLSPEQRVTCAEQAVDRAQRQLDRVTRQDGDTTEAEQRLADAEAELAAAQEALAAAEAEPPAEEEVATPPPEELPPPPPEEELATPPSEELPPAPPAEGSTVELQLQKQGDTEEIDRIRKLRAKLRQDREDSGPETVDTGPPDSDAGTAPDNVLRQSGDRSIIQLNGQVIIRQSEEEETGRLLYGARDASVDELPNGFSRTTITRADGTKIVTTRDAGGQIVKRVRIDRSGKQFVMIDDSGYNQGPGAGGSGGPDPDAYRFDRTLPRLRVQIPQDQYVVETRRASRRQIQQALIAPPVERAERLYSLDEIRYSQRLRDKVRRIDVDTITFDFGSAAISPTQFGALTELGEALNDYIIRFPWATILVEGHTDAVGTEYFNLLLSDRRAEAVAVALTSYFGVPPENLVTQGYGEQFLKIDTQLPERLNRRVTLRNITGLVQGEF